MAVPKRKVSRMKRGFRRSADALKQPTYIEDKDSGEFATSPSHRSEVGHVSRPAGDRATGRRLTGVFNLFYRLYCCSRAPFRGGAGSC